jgi:hypothetical protein
MDTQIVLIFAFMTMHHVENRQSQLSDAEVMTAIATPLLPATTTKSNDANSTRARFVALSPRCPHRFPDNLRIPDFLSEYFSEIQMVGTYTHTQ